MSDHSCGQALVPATAPSPTAKESLKPKTSSCRRSRACEIIPSIVIPEFYAIIILGVSRDTGSLTPPGSVWRKSGARRGFLLREENGHMERAIFSSAAVMLDSPRLWKRRVFNPPPAQSAHETSPAPIRRRFHIPGRRRTALSRRPPAQKNPKYPATPIRA